MATHIPQGVCSAPSLSSHFKVWEIALLKNAFCDFLCVCVWLWLLRVCAMCVVVYSERIKMESELWQLPWEENGEGEIEKERDGYEKSERDLAPCTQHFHWLSTTVWMSLTPKSLPAFFERHLHFREILLPWAREVVLLNCLRTHISITVM